MIASRIVTTRELDDIHAAAAELLSAAADFELKAHSCGLLHFDYDSDGAGLSRLLSEGLGIDIIGCSTIGSFDAEAGFHDMTTMLTLLTSDDCELIAGVTDELTPEAAVETLCDAYRQYAPAEPVKLIYLMPAGAPGIVLDDLVDGLSVASGRAPILGGVPSDLDGDARLLVINGRAQPSRAVFLLFSGALRPVFSIGNVLHPLSVHPGKITRAEGVSLMEIDHTMNLIDFFEREGIPFREAHKSFSTFYQKYPLLIEDGTADSGSAVRYVRDIDHVDMDTGYGYAVGRVPQGAQIYLAELKREDIQKSVEVAVSKLQSQIDEAACEGPVTVLSVSCAARYLTMNPNHHIEGEQIRGQIPPSVSMSGFYSYGEFCPAAQQSGRAVNRFHNCSIVFCALLC